MILQIRFFNLLFFVSSLFSLNVVTRRVLFVDFFISFKICSDLIICFHNFDYHLVFRNSDFFIKFMTLSSLATLSRLL